jgi:hypothetical protein
MIPFGLTSGGLCGFPTLQPAPQNCGELFFFFFSQRRRDLPAVGRRKEIVVHLSALSSCLPVCLPEAFAALRALFFFLFSSRKAHRVWHGLDQLMLKIISQKKELHFCNSFDSIEPLAGIEPATY